MYHLLCSSYNVTSKGLLLRNNFINTCPDESLLLELLEKWSISEISPYPFPSISEILEGKSADLDDVVIHVRIVRF